MQAITDHAAMNFQFFIQSEKQYPPEKLLFAAQLAATNLDSSQTKAYHFILSSIMRWFLSTQTVHMIAKLPMAEIWAFLLEPHKLSK